MNKAEYYLKGFYLGNFKNNEDLEKLLFSINQIHKGQLKDGFNLVEKYKNSKDLKPEVHTYDSSFIDILFSNDIPNLLKDIVGRDLFLAHVQLRISYKGGFKSYMIWHRDTNVYGGKVVGNIPPAHKIIFYPTVDGAIDDKIKVVPGSHRRVFGNKIFDFLQIFFRKKIIVKSSDSQFLLFNTELFHHVVPEIQEKGSFRLIYSFVEKECLTEYKGGEKLIEMYKNRLS